MMDAIGRVLLEEKGEKDRSIEASDHCLHCRQGEKVIRVQPLLMFSLDKIRKLVLCEAVIVLVTNKEDVFRVSASPAGRIQQGEENRC